MAMLKLECACGQIHTFRCQEDDSTKKVAEMCGWELKEGYWVCPLCAQKAVPAK